MLKPIHVTECQHRRILRNNEIVVKFRAMEGAMSAITSSLSVEYKISVSAIRNILRQAKCIGWPLGPKYLRKR